MDFNNKNVLITGAGKRLGRAMALALGEKGAHIIAHYNHSQKEAFSLIEELGGGFALQGGLEYPEEATKLFKEAREKAGEIDILINNASIFPESSLMNFSEDELIENINIHAASPLRLCREFYKQNRPGQIINMIDTMIKDYDKKHVAYHLSKQVLFSLTRMMAVEFAPHIRVNAIAPGIILPPPGQDESYFETIKHTNCLCSHGTKKDITKALIFLLDSPFITGQTIFVDGGRHLKGSMYGT